MIKMTVVIISYTFLHFVVCAIMPSCSPIYLFAIGHHFMIKMMMMKEMIINNAMMMNDDSDKY